jgi:hypothetical protein
MKTLEELNAQIGRLHDAALLRIDVQWAEGTVTLGVRTASGPMRIVVRQVTRLVCPRESPWGRSLSINEVRLGDPPSSAAFQVEIEMQSGDVLVICGSEIGVEV